MMAALPLDAADARASLGAGLPERVRNRLLRRVDWRFLLPEPEIGTSVCFADGALAEGVRAISRRVAGRTEMGASELAVARDPDEATLQAAWHALRPGGTLYCEFRSLRAPSATGIQRRLRAAGFEPIAGYRTWPAVSSGRVKFWIPLDAPGAQDHLWEQHVLVRFPALRRGGTRTRALWKRSLASPIVAPLCFVARKPAAASAQYTPDPAAAPLPGHVADVLRQEWERWGFGDTPRRFSWLVLTLGPRAISKVVGIVHGEDDPSPRLVVKAARVPDAAPGLRREARVLEQLGQRFPGGIAGVPRFLFLHDEGAPPVLGEEALVGAPLWRCLRPGNCRAIALRATDWLADFARRSAASGAVLPAERISQPAFDAFRRHFGSVVESRLLHETERVLARLPALPVVFEQRDFSPWNVLVGAAGALQVLDWESAEPDGLPLLDLVYFLGYLDFFASGAIRRNRLPERYRAGLDPSSPFGRIRAECIARYCAALGMDPELVRPLSVLTWLIHTRSEYRHFTSDAAGAPSTDALRRSLFVGLWRQELLRGGTPVGIGSVRAR